MFILASASPRRRALLTSAGVSFTVIPADTDETWLPGELPRAYVLRVARAKASAVAAHYSGARVLAADTTVAIEDRVLGKPVDAQHAAAMLGDLSGREHHVHTAVVLRDGRHETHRIVTTRVRFRKLGLGDIQRYIDTGEPFDKAGGYGIQGEGGALVEVVHGSYTNVVGLPLLETLRLLGLTEPR
jgi:septum formation protein